MKLRQQVARRFFSRPRSLLECQNLLMAFAPDKMPDDMTDQRAVEEALTDVFETEMIDLDLHFKRA